MFVEIMQTISLYSVPLIILLIPMYALFVKKVKVYEVFCEGAKEGFDTAIRILPFLVAMLFSIGVLRMSGALDMFIDFTRPFFAQIGLPSELLPMFVMRPLSGGAAQGVLVDLLEAYGPDSFIGRAGSTMYGSTETTLYVLAVYFGSVGVIKARHAVAAGFMADAAGMISEIGRAHV